MHRSDKAPEPSMEEILASIRKIIAEEPIGPKAGTAPSTRDDEAHSSALPLPPVDDEPSDGPPYSVEDALADLMEDSPKRRAPVPGRDEVAPKPTSQPVQSSEQAEPRPSWLFGRAGGAPSGYPQPGLAPAGRREPSSSLRDQLDAMRPGPERTVVDSEASEPKPGAPQKSGDAKPLFERARGAAPPELASFPTLPSGQSDDVPRPAPQRVPPREASGAAKPGEQRGAAGQISGDAGVRAVPEVPVPTTRGSEPAPTDVPVEGDKRESKPVSPPTPGGGQHGAVSGRAEVPQPAARVPPKSSEAAAEAAPSATRQPAARTLEDTVADLLRPMLREWLDANMPRIVEKALRVELAASAKRPESDGSR